MYDLLVKDALIVTCNPEHSVIDGAVMAVRDGKIALIAPAQSDVSGTLEAKNYISAKGKMVLPGLINMHCHAGDSLFRGLVENLPLEAWLNRVWIAEKAILTPHTTYLGSVLGFAENLLSGVTSVMDMFWYPHEAVRAAQMLGMRVSTGGLFFDFPGIGERSHEKYIEEAKEFSSRYSGSTDVFPCVMPHGAYTVSPEHLKDAKSIANADGGLFCTHAAETRAEQADIQNRYGRTVIRHLDAYDLLGERTVLAHCVHVDDGEIDLMSKSGTTVVHNPMSNLKLASGIAPTAQMQKAGVHLTLGTDGAISGNDLDMWLAMRLASSLAKGVAMEPAALPAKDVLHMATLNGARALGQEKHLGSLEVGKQADFIFVDVNTAHAVPLFDPITHCVFGAGRSDVSDVFVAGEQVVKDRRLTRHDLSETLIEVQDLMPAIKSSLEDA
ncbi:MAG: amidohydrolase [Paracoccaceae bacterium]